MKYNFIQKWLKKAHYMHLYLIVKLNLLENNKNKQNTIRKYASKKFTKLLFVNLIAKKRFENVFN